MAGSGGPRKGRDLGITRMDGKGKRARYGWCLEVATGEDEAGGGEGDGDEAERCAEDPGDGAFAEGPVRAGGEFLLIALVEAAAAGREEGIVVGFGHFGELGGLGQPTVKQFAGFAGLGEHGLYAGDDAAGQFPVGTVLL